jgi:uncharacterized cysteine cluster protein YcgN (CxxCxxCC family)
MLGGDSIGHSGKDLCEECGHCAIYRVIHKKSKYVRR